jgi:hypothetical protein
MFPEYKTCCRFYEVLALVLLISAHLPNAIFGQNRYPTTREFYEFPGTADSVVIEGARSFLVTDGVQSAFIVKMYDRRGVPTNAVRETSTQQAAFIRYRGPVSGLIPLKPIGNGTSEMHTFIADPSGISFTTAGTYTFFIRGASQHLGTVSFQVRDSARFRIVTTQTFQATELRFFSQKTYPNPHRDLRLSCTFTHSITQEKRTVQGFWDGDSVYKIRAFFPQTGEWYWETTASDTSNGRLHRQVGSVDVQMYEGNIPLFAKGTVKVTANKRTLAYNNNEPFFWLGDTAWEMVWKSTLPQAKAFILDRRAKGFTTLQIVSTSHLSLLAENNTNGEAWYINNDHERINPAYFRYLDTLVQFCNDNDIIPVLVPIWGHITKAQPSPYYPAAQQVSEENARLIARHVAARYAGHQVFWIIGGDNRYETPAQKAFWASIAATVHSASGRDHLTTVHPAGYQHSLDYFDNTTPWIDFTMYQSSHVSMNNDYPWRAAQRGWNAQPPKPTLNGEAVYEDIYDNLWEPGDTNRVATQRITPVNIRKASYESVLNGAIVGITYGANGIFQWSVPNNMGAFYPRVPVDSAKNFIGSTQIGILKRLMQQHRWFEFAPRPSLLVSAPDTRHIPIAGSARHIVCYLPESTSFLRLNLAGMGANPRVVWYNPATGDSVVMGNMAIANASSQQFTSPNPRQDWLLAITSSVNSTFTTDEKTSNAAPLLDNVSCSVSPNPVSSELLVRYRVPEAALISVVMRDARERVVANILADSPHETGEYQQTVAVQSLPSGVYSLHVVLRTATERTRQLTRTVVIRR